MFIRHVIVEKLFKLNFNTLSSLDPFWGSAPIKTRLLQSFYVKYYVPLFWAIVYAEIYDGILCRKCLTGDAYICKFCTRRHQR